MRCVKIEYIDCDSDLYDLEIEGGSHNYIAEGIVVHNTNLRMLVTSNPLTEGFGDGHFHVASKGLGNTGTMFRDNESNTNNIYVKTLKEHISQLEKVLAYVRDFDRETNLFVFGEVFGSGVQDLTYGQTRPIFRVFDVKINNKWLNFDELEQFCYQFGFEMVPVLYYGPFDRDLMLIHTMGSTTFGEANVREGVVVKPMTDRPAYPLSRAAFKSINPAYLTRKGSVTEFN